MLTGSKNQEAVFLSKLMLFSIGTGHQLVNNVYFQVHIIICLVYDMCITLTCMCYKHVTSMICRATCNNNYWCSQTSIHALLSSVSHGAMVQLHAPITLDYLSSFRLSSYSGRTTGQLFIFHVG